MDTKSNLQAALDWLMANTYPGPQTTKNNNLAQLIVDQNQCLSVHEEKLGLTDFIVVANMVFIRRQWLFKDSQPAPDFAQ